MGKPIRVLILEDTETDAELMEEELREAGIAFVSKRVAAEQAYLQALDDFSPGPDPVRLQSAPVRWGVSPARGKKTFAGCPVSPGHRSAR